MALILLSRARAQPSVETAIDIRREAFDRIYAHFLAGCSRQRRDKNAIVSVPLRTTARELPKRNRATVPLLPENGRYRLSGKPGRSRDRPIGETQT
jgi:hypothetical protein